MLGALKMSNTKKYLLIALALVVIIVLIVVFSSSSKQTPKPVTTSLEQVTDTLAQKPQTAGGHIYFIDQSGFLSSVNLVSKEVKIIYQTSGEILDYYFSPDGKKAIVAESTNDQTANVVVNVETSQKSKSEDCFAEAIAFISTDQIIANCVSQTFEYDPNTINSIVLSDPNGYGQRKIIDLNFDPLKKIVSANESEAVTLTNNSGFGENDLYRLDLTTKSLNKITNDGFILDARFVEEGKYLFLSKRGEKAGKVFLYDETSSQSTELGEGESLQEFSYFDQKLIKFSQSGNRKSIVVSALDNPSLVLETYSLPNQIESINGLFLVDNNAYVVSDQGILKIPNI